MMEYIARVEWIGREQYRLRTDGVRKHLQRRKGEGVETENIFNVEGLQSDSGAEET